MNEEIKPKQVLYYAQILPSVGIYHVLEMKVAQSMILILQSQKSVISIAICSIMKMLVKQFSSTEVSA